MQHGVHESVIATSPEVGVVMLNITRPMLAATLVEVDEISYMYLALQDGISETSLVKVRMLLTLLCIVKD